MKRINLEELRNDVDVAYSINYTVLENIEQMLPCGNNSVFSSEDVFNSSSREEIANDYQFEENANIRNTVFSKIRDEFEETNLVPEFKIVSQVFLERYYDVFQHYVKRDDVFSERNISNWIKFNSMISEVLEIILSNQNDTQKTPEELELSKATTNFLGFLRYYKDWLTEFEVFEKLDKDITEDGSRSVFCGKDTNPDILTIEVKDFNNTATKIIDTLNELKDKYSSKISDTEKLTEIDILQLTSFSSNASNLERILNSINNRIKAANTNLIREQGKFAKLISKIFAKKRKPFSLDKIYVHKNELVNLFSEMKGYPELKDEVTAICELILGDSDFTIEYISD